MRRKRHSIAEFEETKRNNSFKFPEINMRSIVE